MATDPTLGDLSPATPPDEAIERLLERHGRQLFALGLRLCGTPEDAEDLVQDTMISAWRNWGRFRGEAKPSTWLWTIAARACQRKKRLRAGEPRRLDSLTELGERSHRELANVSGAGMRAGVRDAAFASPDSRQDEALARDLAREAMRAAILELPAEFRLPLVMRDVLEIPAADVARALGLEETTVRTRVHRARLRLREALQPAQPTRLPARPPAGPSGGRQAAESRFDRRVCLDLLEAKLDAQDSGRAFVLPGDAACDRCASVFAELDLAKDACALLGDVELPPAFRDRVAPRASSAARR